MINSIYSSLIASNPGEGYKKVRAWVETLARF